MAGRTALRLEPAASSFCDALICRPENVPAEVGLELTCHFL